MSFHSQVSLGARHSLQDLEFANAAARLAASYVAADEGKVYRDLDNDTWHLLVDATGPTFREIGMSSGSLDHGGLGGLGDDDHAQYFNTARLVSYFDRFHFENNTPANNNTTTLVDYINQSVPFSNTALYKIRVDFVWSMNSGATDFIADLLVGGTSIVEPMVWEPQDTAGGGPFGTDQRYHASMTGVFNATGAAQNVQFQFAASTAGDNAAVYRAHLFVERWI